MSKNPIRLPLFETVSRSFMYIIKNLSTLGKICSVFIVLWFAEMLCGLPALCSVNESYCIQSNASNVLLALLYLSMAIVSVNTIRSIILKQEFKWFHLSVGAYTLRYIGYAVLLWLMVVLPTAMILMISHSAGQTQVSVITAVFLGVASFATCIGMVLFCLRLYLVYAGSAIGDRDMTLGKSYTLTAGNMLKIFGGLVLIAVPTFVIVAVLTVVYRMTEWGFIGDSVFVLLGMLCSYFDTALKASFYSHLYQYFVYFSKKD